jgi:uncharacterized integral membrane protein
LRAVSPTELIVEIPLSTERLRLAVAGLGGIAGALLVPVVSSWLGLLMQLLEGDSSGLGPRRGISGLAALKALLLTILLAFIAVNWQQAASELRQMQSEAPIFGATLSGFAVGLAIWTLYALGLSALRADFERARLSRRVGGLLR